MKAWTLVALISAASIALKAAGPFVVGDRPLPPIAARVLRLLAPAVLAALVAVSVFGGDRRLVLDARAAGVAAGAVALALRAPLLLVVVVAAVVAALVRAA